MKIYRQRLVLLMGLFFMTALTGGGAENVHYDRMKALAEHVRSSSTEAQNAIRSLLEYSKSDDHWDRYYAIVFIGQILHDKNAPFREQLLPGLLKALDDKDQATRRAAVSAIRDTGTDAVERALPKLIRLVDGGEENDVSWFAAEALGKVRSDAKLREVVEALFTALDRPSTADLPADAPQVRYYALSALIEIGADHRALVLPELRKRMSVKDKTLAEKISGGVAKLDQR